MSGGNLIA